MRRREEENGGTHSSEGRGEMVRGKRRPQGSECMPGHYYPRVRLSVRQYEVQKCRPSQRLRRCIVEKACINEANTRHVYVPRFPLEKD